MSIITWGEGQGGVGAFDVKAGDIRASAETPLPASAVSWFPFISSWTLRGRNLGSVSLGLSRWGRVYTGEADSSLSGMKPGIGRWGGTVLVFLGEDLAAPDREPPAQRRGSTIERALTRYLFPGRTVLVVGNQGDQAQGGLALTELTTWGRPLNRRLQYSVTGARLQDCGGRNT